MSHFVNIQTQIKDLEALRAACQELGFPILENTEARGIGTMQPADYVIRLKGPCDIAVRRHENPQPKQYTLGADWWGGHVEQEVGKNYGRLLQLYALHKASKEALKRGLTVKRSSLKNGAIKLSLSGGAL